MKEPFTSQWCEQAKRPGAVLIVDDDDNDRALFRESVSSFNCEVLEAQSGASALEVLKARPDLRLIVLDETMPGMNGVELFRRLRLIGNRTRVVFLTGHVREIIEQVSEIGFATILNKSALLKGTALSEMMAACGYPKKQCCESA